MEPIFLLATSLITEKVHIANTDNFIQHNMFLSEYKCSSSKNINLKSIKQDISGKNCYLDAATLISKKSSYIVANAVKKLANQNEKLITVNGGLYKPRQITACLRDSEIILRHIIAAIFVQDSSLLDCLLLDLKMTYISLGVAPKNVAVTVDFMKEEAINLILKRNSSKIKGSTGEPIDCPFKISRYFDKVISALS